LDWWWYQVTYLQPIFYIDTHEGSIFLTACLTY
jgi:hypothetical protein